jgi:hypothetical protein
MFLKRGLPPRMCHPDLLRRVFLLVTLVNWLTAGAQDSTAPKRYWWVPHHATVQYAGGIGFIAAGVGYANRKDKVVTDFLYGYVPESVGGVTIHTATAKIGWWPIKALGKGAVQIKPLGLGLLVNYTFGKQYFAFSPRYYDFGYYDHPTALHGAVFVSSAFQTRLKPDKRIKQWRLYYELLTYDVELVSYLGNKRSLSVGDILTLGIGVKAKF